MARWTSVGTDPDDRFSLANERTFLAWIRTVLSLVAGGILLLLLTTAGVAVFGHHRERAMLERGRPCAPPFMAIALIAGQTALAGGDGLACVYWSVA